MMDLAAASSMAEVRARRSREYLQALEEERQKIQVFQRELPLSFNLVSEAIESYRQQMAAELFAAGCAVRSELGEEEEMASEGGPVLEEFIPIKRSHSSESDDEEEAGNRRLPDHQCRSDGGHNDEDSSGTSRQQQHEAGAEKRPDWLRSTQLWSQHPDPCLPREAEHTVLSLHVPDRSLEDMNPRRPSVAVEAKGTGAFLPFHLQKRSPPPPPPVEAAPVPAPAAAVPATSSTSETRGGGGGGGGKSGCSGGEEKDGQPHRKARRCWSPELHRRFLGALQQLGGSDAATPKRIRELMKVDGLTNDEVKSHLQKYRLHSRRPNPTSIANASSPPPQQVVFVGGIWVPPPEYAAAAAAAAAVRPPSEGIPTGPPSRVYAPIASVPTPNQQQQQQQRVKQPHGPPGGREEQCVADDGATHSDSSATSSSCRTTTSCPGRRR